MTDDTVGCAHLAVEHRTISAGDGCVSDVWQCALCDTRFSPNGNQVQPARHQPCGCVICFCEGDGPCTGCGAKFCGTPACVFKVGS